MQRISQFFSSFLDGVSPIFSTMFLFFCYVMFPDEAYIPAAGAVLAMMFIRESQSCVENLIDSGHDLQWLMVFLRKKEKKVKDDEDGKN